LHAHIVGLQYPARAHGAAEEAAVEDVGVWTAAELDVVGVGAAAEVGVGVWAACELADVGV